MTKEEKIKKISDILTRYCNWVNHLIETKMIYDMEGLRHSQTYPSLMLWCDYNCKEDADEVGRENIWNNFKRICRIEKID